MSAYENAPTHGRSRGANQNTLQRNYNTSPLHLLLDRLENVKPIGDGYRACCPAHESKSRNTLTIKQADDGRVLLHDFGGCSALDVVHGLGLELSDLFEKPITHNMSPGQRRELREKVKMARWKAARSDLVVEINILLLTAGQAYRGEPISDADMDRMKLAGVRIRHAMGEL